MAMKSRRELEEMAQGDLIALTEHLQLRAEDLTAQVESLYERVKTLENLKKESEKASAKREEKVQQLFDKYERENIHLKEDIDGLNCKLEEERKRTEKAIDAILKIIMNA